MKVAFFSTKSYDRASFSAQQTRHEFLFLDARLTPDTAVLALGCPAVCAFVNDRLDAAVIALLAQGGSRLIALRSAGFNHVDLVAAARFGLTVARVPEYSPYAVAEHAAALLLSLNRKIHRAYARVRDGNFSLEGLLGFDLHDRTIGIVGTGKIGAVFARIVSGFGCRMLAFDPRPNPVCADLGVAYVTLETLLAQADIISLHCPLTPETRHLINKETLAQTKRGVMLVNTGRGGLIDTAAVLRGLKSGHVGALGLDVYEEEAELFFEDRSNLVLQDDVFARLLTFPNVLITGHQAFLTEEALQAIAATTCRTLDEFEEGRPVQNVVRVS